MSNAVEVELTQYEINLLLEYAYPFDEEKEQLLQYKDMRGVHTIKIDCYYLPLLIGDLVYSAKKINSEKILNEFDMLCILLENAENNI